MFRRYLIIRPYSSNTNYLNYLASIGNDIKTKTSDVSQKQMDLAIEASTIQAINALEIANQRLLLSDKLQNSTITTSVTFNVGIMQLNFSATKCKS